MVFSFPPVSVFQMRTVRSRLPETTFLPSRDQATSYTPKLLSADRTSSHRPLSALKTLILMSAPHDTMRFPSFVHLTPNTPIPVLALTVRSHILVSIDQIRISLSVDPDITRVPSGEKPIQLTRRVWPGRKPPTRSPVRAFHTSTHPVVYPAANCMLSSCHWTHNAPAGLPPSRSNTRSHSPLSKSHTPMVASVEAVANRSPSRLTDKHRTSLEWPSKIDSQVPVVESHNRTVLSCEPVTTKRSSTVHATHQTEAVCPTNNR
mmetsp:Transcript_9033/g.20863  ORF Transcript_9033/g.20863 Transcript_9033/m.20863 type:complete len:262 (+) Transcript_9033:1026-1811(+)